MSIRYGEIIQKFREQLPGIKIDDVRPYKEMSVHIWLANSPVNLLAQYKEETDTFYIATTKEEWNIEQA